ncbi:hypothetical protein [Halorussus litoreus]|uniref:hypothetical protein n=1 Tax=Halorussus litoreus TaxID=1710536 RepID=UPI000E28620F|nr:hypothetical protein [Halorussus litoreus]
MSPIVLSAGPLLLSAGPLLLSAGVVVGLVTSVVVYADAARRGRSQSDDRARSSDCERSARLLWPVSVGLTSLAGFVVPYWYDEALRRAYFAWVKSSAVVTSPYEMLALHFAVGVGISIAAVLVYGFGSQYDSLTRSRTENRG